MTNTSRPVNVGLGVSVLANGLNNNAVDGIGTYTAALRDQITLSADLNPTLFAFRGFQQPDTLPSIVDAGRFHRQVATSLLTGREFHDLACHVDQFDLFHATDHLVPRLKSRPVVATLMDAIPLAHPEWVSYPFKTLTNHLWRQTFLWADRVITISEFSKGEIIRWFRIPEERIDVIPLGVDPSWAVVPCGASTAKLQKRLNLPSNFLLNIGTLQPRKNIERLLDAHQLLSVDEQEAFPLIVVGRPGWGCDALIERLETADPLRVRWLSRLTDDDLRVLMHLATGFVFPSRYEGFGLPILEAFSAGTPVAAAQSTSIPEVVGDCALLFDPMDSDSIVDSLRKLISNEYLCQQLVLRGRARVKEFTWDRVALRTHDVYQTAL